MWAIFPISLRLYLSIYKTKKLEDGKCGLPALWLTPHSQDAHTAHPLRPGTDSNSPPLGSGLPQIDETVSSATRAAIIIRLIEDEWLNWLADQKEITPAILRGDFQNLVSVIGVGKKHYECSCLRFSHGHMPSLSVAWQTLDNPPHALPRSDPLHKIWWEEADSVATLTLNVTANNTIRRHLNASVLKLLRCTIIIATEHERKTETCLIERFYGASFTV